MEQQLRSDQGFRETCVPSGVTNVIFRATAFQSLVDSIKNGPEADIAPDIMGGISVDLIRDHVKEGALEYVRDENLLLAIRPKDFANPLRLFVNNNWDDLKGIPLRQDCLTQHEKTGVRKELSLPPYQQDKYPITHLLTLMTMSFYRRIQQVMIEDLSKRNFVIGADGVIKKDILRTNHPKGHVVKISANPMKRKVPIIVPRHPNLIETGIFPLDRLDGSNRLMVLNEDIQGAKRLDKMNYDELPIEERLGAVLQTMSACIHLHNLDLVYHDIKPGNMFEMPDNGIDKHWILADSETIIEEGMPYPKNHLGPLFYATEEYLDAMYYQYDEQVLSHTSKAIDIFAYAMTIFEQYIADDNKFDEFCEILRDEKNFIIDLELVEYALKKVGCINKISHVVLDFIVKMLAYDRRMRPDIRRVYQVLSRHL